MTFFQKIGPTEWVSRAPLGEDSIEGKDGPWKENR